MKHVPSRSCIVCREQKDKSQLVRIVRSSDGEVTVDTTGKAPGRGAYVCASGDCIKTAINKRLFNRAFKQQLSMDVYDGLRAEYDRMIGYADK